MSTIKDRLRRANKTKRENMLANGIGHPYVVLMEQEALDYIIELEAENQRLRDAAWAMVEKEAAKHLPAYEKQHKRIAELEVQAHNRNEHISDLEAKVEALREAHKANVHQEVRTSWSAKGHRCEWRVAYEAVNQRSKAALEVEK